MKNLWFLPMACGFGLFALAMTLPVRTLIYNLSPSPDQCGAAVTIGIVGVVMVVLSILGYNEPKNPGYNEPKNP